MITLFTIPKPFTGHFALIQQNAIHAWTKIHPDIQLLLLGDDQGTAQLARKLELQHLPQIKRNEFNTPLLDDVFHQAAQNTNTPYLGYVNADIILLPNFYQALQAIAKQKRRFLMVGQRTDCDITQPINFEDPNWEESLTADVAQNGILHRPTGIDYFIYRRNMWGKIPPFAIGRFSWDNWLVYRALQNKIPVIDATESVLAIHQNHDYSHAKNGSKGARRGPEARLNFTLAGGLQKSYTIWDSTHILQDQDIRPRQFDAALGGGIWSYRRRLTTV